MNRTALKIDHGQALVLMALMMVGLIAFVGLAVDGGMAYAQRREAQNAADSSAVAGTYELRVQHRTQLYSQSRVRAAILRAAAAHNVADSNDDPTDNVNTNAVAYFTDPEGNRLPLQLEDETEYAGPCEVGVTCSTIPDRAWGIDVELSKPFDTFFVGVIGLDDLTVGARASAVTHPGASTYNNEQWAVFATNYGRCSSNNQISIQAGSAADQWEIYGNLHSNGSMLLQNVATDDQISYVTRDGCSSPTNPALCTSATRTAAYPGLVAGTLAGFSGLVSNVDNTAPNWTVLAGPIRSSVTLGSYDRPFTRVNGNLELRNNSDILTLYGLIYVNGDVVIKGPITALVPPSEPEAGTCGANQPGAGRFTIVASGKIEIDLPTGISLNAAPYINPDYDILENNTAVLYSGWNPNGCTAAINFTGNDNTIYGSVAAPFGAVSFSGNLNDIHGTLIGHAVNVQGSSGHLAYDAACFPEQPDYIEMIR